MVQDDAIQAFLRIFAAKKRKEAIENNGFYSLYSYYSCYSLLKTITKT